MKPTLLILAAGMGSRYGGLKQVDPVGPHNQAIIDYSIYDAIRAGFGKVVFVIREHFADAFKASFDAKLKGKIKTEYVFQEMNSYVPEDIPIGDERKKPWGTGHAVLVAREVIHEAFAVINADDFYGPGAYALLHDYLMATKENAAHAYCMVGYPLGLTLSDYGSVSRGICEKDENDFLKTVVECTHIEKEGHQIVSKVDDSRTVLTGEEVVPMNTWGFMPSFFDYLKLHFESFLRLNANKPTAEFYIPTVVNELIGEQAISLKVLESKGKWFGVTYKEDRETAVKSIQQLIEDGTYPENLWS